MLIFIYLFLGIVLLYYGAEWLIKGACSIALNLRISQLIIGLTVVAFGTSAPELVVSLKASVSAYGDIAIGNVIGSNIANICLILGIASIISPIKIQKQILNFDLLFCIIISIVLWIFIFFDAFLGRLEGIFLVGIFLIYIFLLWKKSLKEENLIQIPEELSNIRSSNLVSFFLVFLGIISLVGGGYFFVEGAVKLARLMKISEAVIGLTIVAVGTSLPELAASVVAAIKKKDDISVGNIVGSNIFNICLILGLSSIISPIKVKDIGGSDFFFMLFSVIILYPIMLTGNIISRREGGFLLLVYVVYIIFLF
ncbi:MAG TPA: calcium/sodium antiporter [Victivallales bacterium]|nr:calcium/sodium antiporter [Victivallales bacterium]